MPDAIRAFRTTRPGVSFQVHDVIAGRGLALVRSEEVEILARMPERLVVVHPAGHPIGRAKSVTAETLAALPLVLMHPDTSVRVVTDAAFARAGLAVTPSAEAIYMMTAVAMVRAGLGLAILPETVREVRAEPSLATVRIGDPAFERPVCFVKRAERSLPPASEAFADLLTRTFASLTAEAGARVR